MDLNYLLQSLVSGKCKELSILGILSFQYCNVYCCMTNVIKA